MIVSNIFTRPATEHQLLPDYLNEIIPLSVGLELLNYALCDKEYDDPKRKDSKFVDLSKIPDKQARSLLRTLSFSAVPLLFKGIKSYEQYFATSENGVHPNICNENTILRRRLDDKIKVLQESAKIVSGQSENGSRTIKLFPQRIIHILRSIFELVEPNRPLRIKPEEYPVLITICGIAAEQYKDLDPNFSSIISAD